MTDAGKLEALLEPIRAKFKAGLNQSRPTFTDFQQYLVENRKITPNMYGDLRGQCHKIAGSASTLGFSDLGVSAAKVEKCIDALIESECDQIGTQDLGAAFNAFLSNVLTALNAGK